MQPVDILILANGPGELATWVRPVVRSLRKMLGDDRSHVRISVVLSPCPHATGQEAAIARSYPEVDRVQGAEHFQAFLLRGKTAENWQWRDRGVVVFLGGDQFFTVAIARRLRYRSVVYAEWDARWVRWVDRFGAMRAEVVEKVSPKYAAKFTIVGDLMAEVSSNLQPATADPQFIIDQHSHQNLIGLLPGSKPAKLAQGVPLFLAIAEKIYAARPQTQFVIPVAPSLELTTLARFADPQQNPVVARFGGISGQLIQRKLGELDRRFLQTANGVEIELWTRSPAYDLLTQCDLCLTTVGANTAELGSLGIPMLVLIPTQQLDAMRAWDGLPGLLANLPGIGSLFATLINWFVLRQNRLFAWPNIWAKSEIVPELIGKLEPTTVAEFALDFLNHPAKLQQMRDRLQAVSGKPGAADKLAQLIREELESFPGV